MVIYSITSAQYSQGPHIESRLIFHRTQDPSKTGKIRQQYHFTCKGD